MPKNIQEILDINQWTSAVPFNLSFPYRATMVDWGVREGGMEHQIGIGAITDSPDTFCARL